MFVPFSVNDFIDRAALVYGQRTGFVDEPDQPAPSLGERTYAEMLDLARRQAAKLDELGIEVGERVAIISHNSARLLTSFFGVSGSGRILVPINFRLRPEEIGYIVAQSGSRVLYIDPEVAEVTRDVDVEWKFMIGNDDDMFAAPGVVPRGWEPDENATATINYTSGTTARPKGVQLTHRNLWTNALTFGLHVVSPTVTSCCTRCRCSTATAGACRSRPQAWASSKWSSARSTGRRSCAAYAITG